jgi:hypothetical protein
MTDYRNKFLTVVIIILSANLPAQKCPMHKGGEYCKFAQIMLYFCGVKPIQAVSDAIMDGEAPCLSLGISAA